MNSQTNRVRLQGGAGAIEALCDTPSAASQGAVRGLAVIAHPHPLFGGTMDNKVVQTLARAFVQCGWQTVRFNFRGVGASEGAHDNGVGELADMLAVVEQAQAAWGAKNESNGLASRPRLALAGFSFGAFVTSHAIAALWNASPLDKAVLIGTAAQRFNVAPIEASMHQATLVVHGEHDDTVSLASVLDWARPQSLPVTVVPGGGHFFHGQLPLLKNLVVRHLMA